LGVARLIRVGSWTWEAKDASNAASCPCMDLRFCLAESLGFSGFLDFKSVPPSAARTCSMFSARSCVKVFFANSSIWMGATISRGFAYFLCASRHERKNLRSTCDYNGFTHKQFGYHPN
jgi:hypothetical protein